MRIDIDLVQAVLIGGQWFEVVRDSFDIGSYGYVRFVPGKRDGYRVDEIVLDGGHEPLVSATGFEFTTWAQVGRVAGEGGGRVLCVMAGPVTAIQAVRWADKGARVR